MKTIHLKVIYKIVSNKKFLNSNSVDYASNMLLKFSRY